METSDSCTADLKLCGRSLRTTIGSFGMSFDTQITRRAPRGTLPSRVSCWRSGRFVDATSTFLCATAKMDASCDPEKTTFEKCFCGSIPISVRKNVEGRRYPEVEFGSLNANVFPAMSSGEKIGRAS